MNCASRVIPHLRERGGRAAIWTVRDGPVAFSEMGALAAGTQRVARAEGLTSGVPVLVLAAPGPRLFAAVLGLIALGIPVMFVEPWMPVADIEHAIEIAKPQAFIGSPLALLWGLRVAAIRRIPRWLHLRRVTRSDRSAPFRADDVDPATPAVITFTTGTTGQPKGIVRSHQCMWDLHEILTDGGKRDAIDAPDLCIFPNIALLHLGTGRGAVIVPKAWSDRDLHRIAMLPPALQPRTLSCGPAFLRTLTRFAERMPGAFRLQSFHVGGALTDCAIFERAFERWNDATFTHVYGGTEAEPVAHADARASVTHSRRRGRFQTLHVGAPIPQIAAVPSPEGLWVSGPNVAPIYRPEPGAHAKTQRVDEAGRYWHCMGDRVTPDSDGWWLGGRASQPAEEFELEQRIYARLGTSACFVHRDPAGRLVLYGENVSRKRAEAGAGFATEFPEVEMIREGTIVRDRRHRARIDRRASLATAGRRNG